MIATLIAKLMSMMNIFIYKYVIVRRHKEYIYRNIDMYVVYEWFIIGILSVYYWFIICYEYENMMIWLYTCELIYWIMKATWDDMIYMGKTTWGGILWKWSICMCKWNSIMVKCWDMETTWGGVNMVWCYKCVVLWK